MIVLLAILNDLPIMTIAYDNVKISSGREAEYESSSWCCYRSWHDRGGIFFCSSLSWNLYLWFALRTTAIINLFEIVCFWPSSIFSGARTRNHFWSVKPATPLFLAIVTTQSIATVIIAQGILLPSIGWSLALFVWGYSFIEFFIIDYAKLPIYRLLEHKGLGFRR